MLTTYIQESKTASKSVKNENDAPTIANTRATSVTPGAMRYDNSSFGKQKVALRYDFGSMKAWPRLEDITISRYSSCPFSKVLFRGYAGSKERFWCLRGIW